MRPEDQRALQREQQRQADNARAAANARQQQQQRDNDAANREASRRQRQQYEDGLRANRERQEARQRKEEQDRKNHDNYMKKLRQQGQQTYPYSPPVQPPYVNPIDYGGVGGGAGLEKSKGGFRKGALIVIGLIVAFAYISDRSQITRRRLSIRHL